MKTTSVSDALALMAFIPLAKTFLPYNQNNCLRHIVCSPLQGF